MPKKSQPTRLTAHGRTLTVTQWANLCSLNGASINTRLYERSKGRNNYTDEQVIFGASGKIPFDLPDYDPEIEQERSTSVVKMTKLIQKWSSIFARDLSKIAYEELEEMRGRTMRLTPVDDMVNSDPLRPSGYDLYCSALGTTLGDAMTYMTVPEIVRLLRELPPDDVDTSNPHWLHLLFAPVLD